MNTAAAGKPRILYVGGSGRSGSTLLGGVLAGHEGFVSVGELRYLWDRSLRNNYLCECGRPVRECPFWTQVATDADLNKEWDDVAAVFALAQTVDRQRYIPSLRLKRLRGARFTRRLDEYGDILNRLYGAILKISGRSVVVDSSKDASYGFLLHALETLDTATIHLVRDSRGVAYSWTRERIRPEVHWKTEYMQRRSPLRSAIRWGLINAQFEMLAVRNGRVLRTRYEDFATAPEATVAAIVRRARSWWPDLGGQQPSSEPLRHSVAGNPLRFDAEKATILLDDEWRRRLPAAQRRVVGLLTAPLLAKYGYLKRQTANV